MVWSAPVLTSLARPAFAVPYGPCTDCGPFSCTEQPIVCMTSCRCVIHEETGACVCVGNSGTCFAPGFGDICDTDADCEAHGFSGHRCVPLDGSCTSCDPTSSLCAAPCPTEGSSATQPEVRAIQT